VERAGCRPSGGEDGGGGGRVHLGLGGGRLSFGEAALQPFSPIPPPSPPPRPFGYDDAPARNGPLPQEAEAWSRLPGAPPPPHPHPILCSRGSHGPPVAAASPFRNGMSSPAGRFFYLRAVVILGWTSRRPVRPSPRPPACPTAALSLGAAPAEQRLGWRGHGAGARDWGGQRGRAGPAGGGLRAGGRGGRVVGGAEPPRGAAGGARGLGGGRRARRSRRGATRGGGGFPGPAGRGGGLCRRGGCPGAGGGAAGAGACPCQRPWGRALRFGGSDAPPADRRRGPRGLRGCQRA